MEVKEKQEIFKVCKKFFSDVSRYLPSNSFLSEKPIACTTKSNPPQSELRELNVLSILSWFETSHSKTFEEFNSSARGVTLFLIASPW